MTTIDHKQAIEHCFQALGHPQGTRSSIAFVRGAEWAAEQLAAPATAPEQMPLERDCICHQYLHLDAYSGGAAPEGLHGALWVVVEGVRKKYVLADQSSEPKDMPALATTPKQPRPFVPWSKEAEMLESWAAQPERKPPQGDAMTTREAFEAFISAPPFEMPTERFDDRCAWPGGYTELEVDLAWQAWKARGKRGA